MRTHRLLSPFTLLLICTVGLQAQNQYEQHDAREGDNVTLKCRFVITAKGRESPVHYWVKSTANTHDNVAINDSPLGPNYKVKFDPENGIFDLFISNVSYERDNGQYECRVKTSGPGTLLHTQLHTITVLTQPQPPLVTPGPHAQTQEGKELNLSCSSYGGSPEPTIKWYRDGSVYPVEAKITHAKTRSEPTVATILLNPTKEDDGATFRCVVWNRAMPEGQQLDATIDVSVNYFPRVEVGPENPLRVEVGGSTSIVCKVDAKPQVTSIRWTRNGEFVSNSFTHTIQGITVHDAGKYMCNADNGLGRPGEKELILDVLFPPSVTLESKTYEAEEGGNVEIRCNVTANPEPISVEWSMEGKSDFHQSGNTLTLNKVNADMAGTYVCRAVNIISSSNGKRVERSNSASIAVLVRHKPGRAFITPEKPIANEGTSVTLTCNAKPPGWPAPQFRWFRDIESKDLKPEVLATGPKYTIPSAYFNSEGIYHCQAMNELGHGELASVTLEVHQPPRFQTKLQTHMTKRSGEQDFFVTCSALGKPRPSVKWFKNESEIKLDSELYEIKNDVTESRNAVYNVQSTLKFNGRARLNTNELLPEDRGVYSCSFENEVNNVNSTMHLRIEHEPILIKQEKKVAYDIMENADIMCRVLSFPKPEFLWYFGQDTVPIDNNSEGHYIITTTTDSNDAYLSILKIKGIESKDYGDYYCKVKNSLGSIRTQIRLQPKGAPEAPRSLESQVVGSSFVVLKWENGFEGGLSNTRYFIRYRRISHYSGSGSNVVNEHCSSDHVNENNWMEYDCVRRNPCNVTQLEQHSTYLFMVKAVNTKGQSNYSNEIETTTKVSKILPPEQLTFDPSSRTITFTVAPTCLPLVAVAEGLFNIDGTPGWQVVETIPLRLSGATRSVQEASLELFRQPDARRPLDELNPRLRAKLCLHAAHEVCGLYAEAEIGTSFVKESSALTTATMVAILLSCFVFILFLGLLLIFCRCKRKENKKERSKDYEMDAMSPAMANPQNQAPPPYYPSTGMENKALEHSMDLGLSMDDSKNAMYATQGGYGYHVPPHSMSHPGQAMPNPDWNMGFIDNNYDNSHNGGSVNSQDSLWQMKMAAGNNAPVLPAHQIMDRQSNYDYDPIAHGGYRTLDDYAPYSHLPHAGQPPTPTEYNMRGSQNPSRQEYCSDPYASVHKPKKPRIDQHNMESPYHEVSGLPDYGAGGMNGMNGMNGLSGLNGGEDANSEDKPPHLSLGYDESLESGYSTPNSRARRVIREIIV